MATTTTYGTVKRALVTLLDAQLDVPVTYAWPGPDTGREAVFLGTHPGLSDNIGQIGSQIATIKAGRKQRQEEYDVELTVWTFRPELTAADAEACETRGLVLLEAIDDILADDPTLGLSDIQWAALSLCEPRLEPFGNGWVSAIGVTVEVHARLT